jgi:hypothetical protein
MERDGAWWFCVDYQGPAQGAKDRRRQGRPALPQAAPVKIQARLLDGDLGLFEAAEPTPAATQAQPASVIAPVATTQNAG